MSGGVKVKASLGAAIETLKVALDVCETNEPINRAEGKIDQADLEYNNALEIRNALDILNSYL